MTTHARFTLLLAVSMLAACDSPDEKANTLFVEASQALSAAQGTSDPVVQFEQLTAAKQTVTNIVTEYPASNAAVRISADEKIGPYSLAELNSAIATLAQRPEFCLRQLTRACFTDMVLTNLDKLAKHDRAVKPEEAMIQIAFGGLPFANIVAPEKVNAIFAASPEGTQINSELMEQAFGFPPAIAQLLRMVGSAKGEQAVSDSVSALKAVPGFQDSMVKNIGRVAYTFLHPRDPNSAKLARAAAKATVDTLPKDKETDLNNQICSLSTEAPTNTIVLADCTPAEMATAGTYFGHIPQDLFDKIYAAAPENKKGDLAGSIYAHVDDLAQRIAWHDRSKYANDFETLTNFYIQATRENNPVRASLVAKIQNAVEKTLDAPALTQAGLTPKSILLHHANGTLTSQLPAIYRLIEAQPGYSYQLFRIMANLAQLQPHTPGMDQMTYFRVIGKSLPKWSKDSSASKDSLRVRALGQYPSNLDPRPAYDAVYGTEPYATGLGFDTLLRFKELGHTDIFDTALAASKPEDEVRSLRFQLARKDIVDHIKAGDVAAALTKLETLPFIARYYVIGHSMQDNDYLSKSERDTFLNALLPKYAYELTAFELGWNKSLSVPVNVKLDTISTHYQKITDFIGESPARWLVDSFGTLTPAQRLQAVQSMHSNNDKMWPLFASAIAIVSDE